MVILPSSGNQTHNSWTQIRVPRQDDSRCTSGFTVTDGSTRGVLTAEHCDGLDEYENTNGNGNTYDVARKAGHRGSQGDMAWYSVTGAEQPEIYRDTSTLDEVSGYMLRCYIELNDYFCFYGIATDDIKCGDVVDAEASVTVGGVTIGNLVAMDGPGLTSTDGDSGGPWFESGYSSVTAVGIHAGTGTSTGRRYFTPVHTALTRFGLSILTDN